MATPPEFVCRFSEPVDLHTLSVTHLLRNLHRAHLLGMVITKLTIGGVPVDAGTVRLLNAWTGAQGAWNASKQDYFEAWRRLDKVLTAPLPRRRKTKRVKLPV